MTKNNRSWRDVIKIHPAAEVFPLLGDADLRALADDIEANGLHVAPIVFEETGKDEHGNEVTTTWLIDGRNRLDAMELLGWEVVDWEEYDRTGEAKIVIESMRGVAIDAEVIIPEQHAFRDVAGLVVSANIRRRHLSKKQQASLIVKAVNAGQPWQEQRTGTGGEDLDRRSQDENLDAAPTRSFNPTPGRKGGSTKGVRGKAVQVAARYGISKATVDRAIAESEGRPQTKAARGSRAATKARRSAKAKQQSGDTGKGPGRVQVDALLEHSKLVGYVRPDGKGFRRAGGDREEAWEKLQQWADFAAPPDREGTVALLRFAEDRDIEHQIVLCTGEGWWPLTTGAARSLAEAIGEVADAAAG